MIQFPKPFVYVTTKTTISMKKSNFMSKNNSSSFQTNATLNKIKLKFTTTTRYDETVTQTLGKTIFIQDFLNPSKCQNLLLLFCIVFPLYYYSENNDTILRHGAIFLRHSKSIKNDTFF